MNSLRLHRDYLEGEWRAAQDAPLSSRKAMLVALLIDAYVDRMFAAAPGVDDILEFRAGMAASSAALGRIMALCGRKGVQLATEAVEIPLADYSTLPIEDFMVSVYNDHSVPRLQIITPDGARHDMMATLRDAIGALD